MSGFHIQIRDMSNPEDNLYYDVVTISGGGTRSHTLSDLRPATKYAIFIMPYHKEHIIGTPSNLKMVSTKEDGKPWRVFYFNDLRFHEKKLWKKFKVRPHIKLSRQHFSKENSYSLGTHDFKQEILSHLHYCAFEHFHDFSPVKS